MDSELEDLADANLVESVRQHALWQRPCEWVEEDGLFLMAGANDKPIAYRNCAIRVDPRLPAAEALKRTWAFFSERERRFTFFLRDSRDEDLRGAVEAAGLKQRSESPCMLLDEPVTVPEAAPGVRIQRFDGVDRVADAVDVTAEAYQSLGIEGAELRYYFTNPEALLSEQVTGFVAYVESRPVATSLTIHSGEGAGLYWVGTVESARGRNLGALCTLLATQAGFAGGARVVTLQASSFGEPLYRKLGYRYYDRLRWYA